MKALVVGAGIGGLAAGIGLAQAGWDVVVHERADPLRASGSGLSLFANAFTALDVLGLGTRVRGLAGPSVAHPQAGQRTPDGRWLSRMPADAVAGLGIVHRQELHGVLTEALAGAGGALRCGSEVRSVTDDGRTVTVRAGEEVRTERADLVVAADGLHSQVRASWPRDPGVRYSGYSAWRGITARPVDLLGAAGETWGRGLRFGIAPLPDGRVYWFAVASLPHGHSYGDQAAEHAALTSLFRGWHPPIPELIAATPMAEVHRLDICDLAGPVPSFRRGRCVLLGDAAHAMTPDLGQGGGQALEDAATLVRLLSGPDRGGPMPGAAGSSPDVGRLGPAEAGRDVDAALAAYDLLRRPRTTRIARSARLLGAVAQVRNPVGAALRNAVLRVLPPSLAAAQVRRIQAWSPPAPDARPTPLP